MVTVDVDSSSLQVTGGLSGQVGLLGLRVGGYPALSLHSSEMNRVNSGNGLPYDDNTNKHYTVVFIIVSRRNCYYYYYYTLRPIFAVPNVTAHCTQPVRPSL